MYKGDPHIVAAIAFSGKFLAKPKSAIEEIFYTMKGKI